MLAFMSPGSIIRQSHTLSRIYQISELQRGEGKLKRYFVINLNTWVGSDDRHRISRRLDF